MSKSFQFKEIKNHSSTKNKLNIIKNMTGMSYPAFQSNKTLKKYINLKLNVYLEKKINLIPKTRTFTKFNEKTKSNLNQDKTNISYNIPHQHLSKDIQNNNISSSKINTSSNSINKIKKSRIKKKKNILSLKSKNNSFIILKYNNKSLCKDKNKKKENSINLNKNENISVSKNNIINNTPINIKNMENVTTPINVIKKNRCIYLNKSLGKEKIDEKLTIKKNKTTGNIANQKLKKNNTHKGPICKNSSNKIKLLKKNIYNNIKNKTLYNYKNKKLNKSYLREELKKSKNGHIKLLKYKNNYSLLNNKENDKNLANKDISLRDKINDLSKNDESFHENKCPIPMPYVKRYSDYIIREKKINKNINLENYLFGKDLKEPDEEKIIPFPTSEPINPNYFHDESCC